MPDEALYDLARARFHISAAMRRRHAGRAASCCSESERARLRFPALDWLERCSPRAPRTTAVTLTTMPIHVALAARRRERATPRSKRSARRGSRAIAARHGAAVVDFRMRSPVTTEDSNYWDPLHYRVGIAARIVAALRTPRARAGAMRPTASIACSLRGRRRRVVGMRLGHGLAVLLALGPAFLDLADVVVEPPLGDRLAQARPSGPGNRRGCSRSAASCPRISFERTR